MVDLIEEYRRQMVDKLDQKYADEIGLIEKYRENYEDFVLNLFREGCTHVGYGEYHDKEILHSSMVKLIPRLKNQVGLNYVCLELENEVQGDIDKYLGTGDEKYLERVKQSEREMLRRGHPVKGRLNGSYFDIIKSARESNVNIIAMDNHKKHNRDKFMASNIPSNGNTLIYVGQFHLFDRMIPQYFMNKTGIQIYRIMQIMSRSRTDDITFWLDSIVNDSNVLKVLNGFGLNLKKHNLHYIAYRHDFCALIGFGSTEMNFDGLLYHR